MTKAEIKAIAEEVVNLLNEQKTEKSIEALKEIARLTEESKEYKRLLESAERAKDDSFHKREDSHQRAFNLIYSEAARVGIPCVECDKLGGRGYGPDDDYHFDICVRCSGLGYVDNCGNALLELVMAFNKL